jgi:hypothetical protein
MDPKSYKNPTQIRSRPLPSAFWRSILNKKRLLGPPQDLPMCLKHSACHAFHTFRKVVADQIFPHFGVIWGPFPEPWTPKWRPGDEKEASRKHIQKHIQQCLQINLKSIPIQTKSKTTFCYLFDLEANLILDGSRDPIFLPRDFVFRGFGSNICRLLGWGRCPRRQASSILYIHI